MENLIRRVGRRILTRIWNALRIVERIDRGRGYAGSYDEGFDIESADKLAVAYAIVVSYDIALVSRKAKREIRHLNHEQVEIGVGRQFPDFTFMISTGPTDSIFTLPCASGATEGKGSNPFERIRSNLKSSPSLSLSKANAGVDNNAAAATAASAPVRT
jgi:hypothetical protein